GHLASPDVNSAAGGYYTMASKAYGASGGSRSALRWPAAGIRWRSGSWATSTLPTPPFGLLQPRQLINHDTSENNPTEHVVVHEGAKTWLALTAAYQPLMVYRNCRGRGQPEVVGPA